MIKYVITAIKKDGLRHMAFDNNHLNTYDTAELAEQKKKAVLENNNPETVLELVGSDLKVLPVECWDSGDSTRTVFGKDIDLEKSFNKFKTQL